MRAAVRLVLCLAVWAVLAPAAMAGRSTPAPDYAAVSAAVAEFLQSPERLPLPLERIRPALTAHYVQDQGSIYWVGTGRMTPFLQRLADAADDGLNPDDYPIDALIQLRDAIEPDDPEGAAAAELYLFGLLRRLCHRPEDRARHAGKGRCQAVPQPQDRRRAPYADGFEEAAGTGPVPVRV